MVHEEKKLTLVFEYCDLDLKKYIDEHGGQVPMPTIKVCAKYYFIQKDVLAEEKANLRMAHFFCDFHVCIPLFDKT